MLSMCILICSTFLTPQVHLILTSLLSAAVNLAFRPFYVFDLLAFILVIMSSICIKMFRRMLMNGTDSKSKNNRQGMGK